MSNSIDVIKNTSLELVSFSDNQIIFTSRWLAEFFNKRHTEVIRDIEKSNASSDFSQRNFASAEYLDAQNKPRKEYKLTKKGALFIGMAYSGEKGASIREGLLNYIENLEAELIRRNTPNLDNYLPIESARFLIEEIEKEKNYSNYVGDENLNLRLQIEELKSKIDPAQAQQIKNAVAKKVKEIHQLKKHFNMGKIFSYVWRCVYEQFNIPSYKDLNPKHFAECLAFVDAIAASNYNPQIEAVELTEKDEIKQEAPAIAPNFDQAVKAQVFFTVVDAINNALNHTVKVLDFTHENLKRADSHFKDQDRLKNKNYGMARACIENALYGKSETFQRYSDASIEDAKSSVKLAASLVKSASGINVFAQAEDHLLASA